MIRQRRGTAARYNLHIPYLLNILILSTFHGVHIFRSNTQNCYFKFHYCIAFRKIKRIYLNSIWDKTGYLRRCGSYVVEDVIKTWARKSIESSHDDCNFKRLVGSVRDNPILITYLTLLNLWRAPFCLFLDIQCLRLNCDRQFYI